MKASSPLRFVKNQTTRKKKSDAKLKAASPERFVKNQTTRKKKSDAKCKAQNLGLFQEAKTERNKKYINKKNSSIDATERLRRFECQTRFGPIFVCRCCRRKLFQHQVVEVDMESFKAKVDGENKGIFSLCIQTHRNQILRSEALTSTHDIDSRNYLCKGCKSSMTRGKMPKMCANNGLAVDILPNQLKLTDLENNLIAKNILYQKVHKKPKSRMAGTHDKLVNIPIGDQDILNTVKSLPRTPKESKIIVVRLKRKLEYKNTHLEQLIDIKKVFNYLHHLKHVAKNNKYQFYDDYNIYSDRCQNEDPEGFIMINPQADTVSETVESCENMIQPEDEINKEIDAEYDEEEGEDELYRAKDPIRKYQFNYDMCTTMIPKFPEAIPEQNDKILNFAPGEGKYQLTF